MRVVMSFVASHREFQARVARAMAMGGPEKLAKRAGSGRLNVRERIARLFDDDTFLESGLFGTSTLAAMRESTPTDGKVCGFGSIQGRSAGAVGYDFTVKGASSAATSNKKMQHIKDVCCSQGLPVVFLGESTGVRMPDIMGGAGMGSINDKSRFLRRRETPWVSAVFGYTFGSAAWHAACSDFNVMRKGTVMAISSPGLVAMATGQKVDPEELGGWKLHSEVTGLADVVVDTDEEAIDAVQRFLSYLPSHQNEPPPRSTSVKYSDDQLCAILETIPESRTGVYDVRKLIHGIVDLDSFYEVKGRYARNATTGLARIDGRSVGIVANNPLYKAGAVDADACDKIVSFIVLCDSFNIPLVHLVDQPGFLVGLSAERSKSIGKVVNWMNALSLCTVPKITVILRKSYGQAFVNMGAGGMADEVAAWWTAEVSFMDPAAGVSIVHGIRREDSPKRYDELFGDMARASSAYDFASVYGAQDVIDPRDTRKYLVGMLGLYESQLSGGVGQHLLASWPTSY